MRLETLMEQALSELKELRSEVKQMNDSFVSQNQHDSDLAEIRAELKSLRKRNWVQNTLSAILGVVLAVLIQHYLRG